MTSAVIQVDHVWKKFRKGEIHDSLRELIPAAFKRLLGKHKPGTELHNREFWALRDVSFEVKRGESLGIIGPNGAGKSTMLKLLSRILKPNRGEYRINGRVSALIEVGAGFHPDLTGRENIYLNGTILGMKKAEIKAKEEAIIDFSGVDSFIDTPVKRYSSGMTARLGFAVAANMEPDVLLVDEVLSVGDAVFREKCIRHMTRLLESEVTVIFISHILEQVKSLCHRTIVLDHGSVAFEGETSTAIQKYIDLLQEHVTEKVDDRAAGRIANVKLCDADGVEKLEWLVGKPGCIEFDVEVVSPLRKPSIIMNFSSISGTYVATANSLSKQGFLIDIPCVPGRHRMRYSFDPMPFADGDYFIEFKLCEGVGHDYHVVWASTQPRAISIRGDGWKGGFVNCDGGWAVLPERSLQTIG